MRLPATNSIKLPGTTEAWIVADGTEPPVAIDLAPESLRRYLPGTMRDGEDPLRDAVLKAVGRMALLAWAAFSRRLNAQQSPRYAAGAWLRIHGDELKVAKQAGETEAEHRARLINVPAMITPVNIKAAARPVIVETFQRPAGVWIEPARDFAFPCDAATDGPGKPRCYVQPSNRRLWATGPYTGRRTAGAYVISTALRPEFWLVLPAHAGSALKGAWTGAASSKVWSYVGSASKAYSYLQGAQGSLFRRLISIVEARRLGGVPWRLFADPALRSSTIPPDAT